jgi:dihydroneopterin aldolase
MTIHIEALTFDTIIGLLDFERLIAQRIIMEVEIEYAYTPQSFINYAEVKQEVEEHIKDQAYILLEDALVGLEKLMHKKYPHITRLFIKISKPDILENCKVSLSKTWIF